MPKRSWIARWKDPLTGRPRARRCRTKAERDAILSRMRNLAWRVDAGIVDDGELRSIEARRTLIEDTLEPWLAELEERGTSRARRQDLELTIRRTIRDTGWQTVGEALENPLRVYVRGRAGLSPRGRNRYLGAWKQWGRWASRRSVGLLIRNPFEDLELVTDASQSRRQRALTVPEADRLRKSDRWPDYLVMLRTGLRWAEAERLTMADVDLEARAIVVPQGSGKVQRQRATLIPLSRDVAAMLEDRRAIGGRPLLRRPRPRSHLWPAELERCGIARDAPNGRATLGSFRATFCTWAAAAGVGTDTLRRLRRDFGLLVEQVYIEREQVLPGLLDAVDSVVDWHEERRASGAA